MHFLVPQSYTFEYLCQMLYYSLLSLSVRHHFLLIVCLTSSPSLYHLSFTIAFVQGTEITKIVQSMSKIRVNKLLVSTLS